MKLPLSISSVFFAKSSIFTYSNYQINNLHPSFFLYHQNFNTLNNQFLYYLLKLLIINENMLIFC